MGERNFRIDNVRAILIFLVVFGHLLEFMPFKYSNVIYQCIYMFHMPGFALLSGFCWKKDCIEKIPIRLIYPYMVFQTLYIVFQYFVLKNDVTLQYTTPYWLMWYLPALAIWELTAAAVKVTRKNGFFILCGSVIISLLIGYDNNVGYFYSLSRVMVLLPFFMLGIWMQNFPELMTRKYSSVTRGVGAAVLCLLGGGISLKSDSINNSWLYHSYSYAAGEYSLEIRCAILLMGLIMVSSIMVLVPNRKLRIISYIGRNTMSVYLLHGFIMRWLSSVNMSFSASYNRILAPLLALFLVMILASPPVAKCIKVITEEIFGILYLKKLI